MQPKSERPIVFLASSFVDDFGSGPIRVPLRERIVATRQRVPVEVWAYEHRFAGQTQPDSDTIIDNCFDGIKKCDLFVFIQSGRYGTGAEFLTESVYASYLELELFAAATLQKPIVILRYRDREPSPRLAGLLSILDRYVGVAAVFTGSEDDLYSNWLDICDDVARTARHAHRALPTRLIEGLSFLRTTPDFKIEIEDPKLLFLDGRMNSAQLVPDIDRATKLLAQVKSGHRVVAGSSRILPHGAALFRIWAAMRELMVAHPDEQRDPAWAALWDSALGIWAAKASWFGLHGHLWMGPLAAVQSQTKLRAALKRRKEITDEFDVREPVGARASAIFSIAQRMRSRERRKYHFSQVIELSTRAIALNEPASQGAHSIRGYARLKMGLLGHPSQFWQARADFKESLARRRSDPRERIVGEGLVDYGFAHLFTGHPFKALDLVQQGVALLRKTDSADGKAFLVRGLRRLRTVALCLGHLRLYRDAGVEIEHIATQIEAMDQLNR